MRDAIPARARGRLGGRPKKLREAKQVELARTLYDGGQTDIATICRTLGISRATRYWALKDGPRGESVAGHVTASRERSS